MEPDGAPVVVPVVVDDLQAGLVGLDWQSGLLDGRVDSPLPKSTSKYGKSNDAGGGSVVRPIIVDGLQNGAPG